MKKEKLTLKLDQLKAPEKNVRKHPEKQIQEMIKSLNLFGQFRDVVVDENNVILAGNGLVMAMREAGYKQAEVTKYYDLTENQKKKLMIADNQTANLGVDDYAVIEEILKSLDGDYGVPGYDDDAVALLVEEASAVADEINSYGVYNSNEVDKIKEVEKSREENGIKPIEQTYQPQPTAPVANNHSHIDGGEPKQEVNKFIVCPHCGEKIYI